jgi:hypothetical protein
MTVLATPTSALRAPWPGVVDPGLLFAGPVAALRPLAASCLLDVGFVVLFDKSAVSSPFGVSAGLSLFAGASAAGFLAPGDVPSNARLQQQQDTACWCAFQLPKYLQAYISREQAVAVYISLPHDVIYFLPERRPPTTAMLSRYPQRCRGPKGFFAWRPTGSSTAVKPMAPAFAAVAYLWPSSKGTALMGLIVPATPTSPLRAAWPGAVDPCFVLLEALPATRPFAASCCLESDAVVVLGGVVLAAPDSSFFAASAVGFFGAAASAVAF